MAREITDDIKLFVQDQLPSFYREEGQMFGAFIDAYYEYLEQNGQSLQISRELMPGVIDVDYTSSQFLEHFKLNFLNGFPGEFKAGTERTIKSILDFYNLKGSPKAVELMFQVLYAEAASVSYPIDNVMRPSNANYHRPKYIEVYAPSLTKLIGLDGQEIVGGTTGAKAFVESVVTKLINNVKVHVIYLSNVRGEFTRGEILAKSADGIQDDMPSIRGSLSAVDVTLGGKDFTVGDIFNVTADNGKQGKVRVAKTDNATGLIEFKFSNGGFGFTQNTSFTTIDVNDQNLKVINKLNEATTYANTTHPTAFDWHEKKIDSAEFLRWETVEQHVEQVGYTSSVALGTYLEEALVANASATPLVQGRTSTATGNTVVANGYVVSTTINGANATLKIAPTHGSFGDARSLTMAYGGAGGNTHQFEIGEAIHEESTVALTYLSKVGSFSADDVVKGTVSGANGVVVSDSGGVLTVNGSFGKWDTDDEVFLITNNQVKANVTTISISTAGATSALTAKTSNTVIIVGDVVGLYNNGKKLHGVRSHAIAALTADPVNSGAADIYFFNANSQVNSASQGSINQYSNLTIQATVIGSNTGQVGFRNTKYSNGTAAQFVNKPAAHIVGLTSNTFANVAEVGTGGGASYEIGSLENTESITIYTDFIGANNIANVAYLDCVIDGGNSGVGFLDTVTIAASGTGYTNGQIMTFDLGGPAGGRPNVNATANVTTDASGNVVSISVVTIGSGFYSNSTANLSNMAGGSNLSVTGNFDYGYGFPKSSHGDYETVLDSVLTRYQGEIGTIASLAKINPGNNYNFDPFTAVFTKGVAGYDRRDIVVNIENKQGEFTLGENVNQTVTLQGQRLTMSGNTAAFENNEAVKQLLATNSVSSTFAVGDIYDHGATTLDIENPRKRIQYSNGFFTVDTSNGIPFTASSNTILSTVTAQTATISAVTTKTQTGTAKGQVYAQTENEVRLRRLSFSVGFNDAPGSYIFGASSGANGDIVENGIYQDEGTRPIGDNAVITANTLAANGIVSQLEVIDSGFGYSHGAELTLESTGNSNIVVSGTANVHFTGVGEGRWKDQESFLNTQYLHDNDYYQTHSYLVESGLSLDKYKDILSKVAHVAGTRMFGRVISERLANNALTFSNATITIL